MLGLSCLLIPTKTSSLFAIPLPVSAAVYTRLFGVRDLLLGLATFRTFYSLRKRSRVDATGSFVSDKGHAGLKMLLWAGLVLDVVDMESCAFEYWRGGLGMEGLFRLGGGAFAAVVVGYLGLRTLQ